jgi:hypothetical protein
MDVVYEPAVRVSAELGSGTANRKGVVHMAIGQDRTKEQLYRQAKSLGIKGRSKMNKSQLKAALSRRSH